MKYKIILIGLGIWLVIDGIYSIIKYYNQTFPEHLIRIIRAGIGLTLIILGALV